MPSDFSARARSAREHIPVPALPMESIRSRSHSARKRRLQAVVAGVAISVAALAAGGAAGAKLYDSVRLRLAGGTAAMTMHSAVMLRRPTAADLRGTMAHATFPVIFPAGLAGGGRIDRLEATPDGRPSAIFVHYIGASGGDGATFLLLDPAVVDTDGEFLKASASLGDVYDWRAGGEVVVASKRSLSADDAGRIKAAMSSTSPAESLAATESALPKLTVIGEAIRLEIAERHRPRSGRSVLLAPDEVRSIPDLARRGAPVLDRRALHLTKIPYANGEIDYRNVKRSGGATVVAVAANGVRAIAAVLRSAGAARGDCGCEILVNQTNGAAYRIWTIPMSGTASAKEYAVDGASSAVKPVR